LARYNIVDVDTVSYRCTVYSVRAGRVGIKRVAEAAVDQLV